MFAAGKGVKLFLNAASTRQRSSASSLVPAKHWFLSPSLFCTRGIRTAEVHQVRGSDKSNWDGILSGGR